MNFNVALRVLGIVVLLLGSSSVLAQFYGKPDLKYSAFFAAKDLDLTDIRNLSAEHWEPLHDGIHHSNFFGDNYVGPSSDANLWIRVQFPRRSSEKYSWIELSPNVGLDGRLAQYVEGRWQWFQPEGRQSNESDRHPVNFLTFALDPESEKRVAYLKLNTSLIYHFKITARTDTEFIWNAVGSNLFNGIILGFLCLAMIYNLVIGVSAGERVYLYYSFYVFCNTIYISVVSGYVRLLFPEWGGMGNMGNLGASLVLFSSVVFVREFLNTDKYLPRMDKALKIMQIVMFLTLIFVTFISEHLAVITTVFLGGISPILLLSAAVMCYRLGHPYARYFLIAWGIFLFTVFIWVAMWAGVFVPSTLIGESFKIGTMLEITLLSMVLAYRYSFLKDQTEQLNEAKLAFKKLSETDELTGVLNRRGFLKRAEEIVIDKSGNSIWLALDVDHFKNFNDQHGHIAGDHLLAEFGNILDTNRRRENLAAKLLSDQQESHYRRAIAGRMGGEEFAVLLTDCTMSQAKLYSERLLDEFKNLLVENMNGQKVGTTLSIGATRIRPGDNLEESWKRADKLLYEAKKQGRDQVVSD